MRPTSRTRFALAVGGFVALTLFLPSTLRESLPGRHVIPRTAHHDDLGTALRTTGSGAAAVVSVSSERVWSKTSGRGRVFVPFADLSRVMSTLMSAAFALALAALVAALTNSLAANAAAPRAPPLLRQQQ